MTHFKKAHDFTARWEGGYVNHPSDPGGETNLGVTRRVWEAWCKERRLPAKAMRHLTMADVLPLYEARYWPAAVGLPWPLSGVAYDIAVNHGPGNLKKMLAQVPSDGSPAARAAALIDAREQFFRAIVAARPSQEVFLKGWLRRVAAQREWLESQEGDDMPSKVFIKGEDGKNREWDGKPIDLKDVTITRYEDGAVQITPAVPAVPPKK
ncbi:glycoside hydrolase family 108 protein [Deinococcus lacus]|uniref:Glycoside hydrolase family 108 protein n=1 Tax=Deinococcus lacus TaxID=392561 RepID=A0ABW1YBI3_9DEIO